jgi:hypothetical protein
LPDQPDRLASLKASRFDEYLARHDVVFVVDQDREHPVAVSSDYRLRAVDVPFADLPWMTGEWLEVIHPHFNRGGEIVPQPRNLVQFTSAQTHIVPLDSMEDTSLVREKSADKAENQGTRFFYGRPRLRSSRAGKERHVGTGEIPMVREMTRRPFKPVFGSTSSSGCGCPTAREPDISARYWR